MQGNQSSVRTTSADVVIVGGGVIGLSIARQLALRGLRHVTVIERGEFGKEASWAAGGILAPQVEADRADGFFELASASRDLFPAFARALQDETGIDVQFEQTGTLYVGFTEADEHEMRRRFDWQTRAGLRVEWLAREDASRLEPNLSPHVRCALRFPDDWQVENRSLTEALVRANQKLGVQLIANCEIKSVRIENGGVTGIESETKSIDAPTVVIAAGAWTSEIKTSETNSSAVQIEPVRGQMLCFQIEPTFARHVIYSARGYLVPRSDGRLLAGSTSEHVGFDKRVTEEGAASIKSMAFEIAPGLESAAIVDSWAGFRPHAPDDLPVLGPAADIDGLFYAAGHYRNGILLSPITAEIIAEAVVNRKSSRLAESFAPDRFRLAAASR
ncbi:MAG TPA: glycine oxidase ThiO [Pyrinomonadaceae bacterium]